MYLQLILTLSCFSHVFSLPVSTSSNCTPSCQWTQWFNVDRPTTESDGGDLETLDNIRAHGYNICRAPKDINCRSVRFPYIPYTDLLYKSQCDRSTGLVCLNRDNVDPCIDYEVQLLCCTCEEEPPKTTVLPAVTTMSTSSNCTPSCQWTQWFNVDRPTTESDGGDLETLDNIRAHGYNICRAPKDINCRSVQFPYIPYTDLLYKSQCDRSTGLVCLNRDNVDPCIDYEVQLLCCTCEEEPPKTTVLPAVTTKTVDGLSPDASNFSDDGPSTSFSSNSSISSSQPQSSQPQSTPNAPRDNGERGRLQLDLRTVMEDMQAAVERQLERMDNFPDRRFQALRQDAQEAMRQVAEISRQQLATFNQAFLSQFAQVIGAIRRPW